MDHHVVVVNKHREEIKKYVDLAIELHVLLNTKLRQCHLRLDTGQSAQGQGVKSPKWYNHTYSKFN